MRPTLPALAARHPGSSYGRGATGAQITRAAKSLGIRWPKSYAAFLRTLGWFDSPELTICGIGAPRHNSVTRNTRSEYDFWTRIHPLPRGLAVISPDGRGGFYCLDTTRMRRAECPVVYWDHELAGYPEYRAEHAARTFESFFRRELRERQTRRRRAVRTGR